jgi:hypothetical protein
MVMGRGEVTTPVVVSATVGLQKRTYFEMHYTVMFDDGQTARDHVTEAGCYEPLTFAVPTFGLGGLPDSPIRKVLAHPHRGHGLEPPETLGASFLGDTLGLDHVHVAYILLSPSNDGKLLFGVKRIGKIGGGVV